MTTSKGREIIDSGWKASGISDAIKLGSEKMPSIDPFKDIDPMLSENTERIITVTYWQSVMCLF